VHPAQRGVLVEQAVVAGSVNRRLGAQLRMGEEAEDIEAIVDRHGHNAPAGHLAAVVTRLGAVARNKAAAVEVHQHRQVGAG